MESYIISSTNYRSIASKLKSKDIDEHVYRFGGGAVAKVIDLAKK